MPSRKATRMRRLEPVLGRSAEDLERTGLPVPWVRSVVFKEKRRDYVFPGERHPGLELCYVDRGAVHAHVSGGRGRAIDMLAAAGTLLAWLPGEFHSLYAAPGPAPNIVSIHALGPLPPGTANLSKRAIVLEAAERALVKRLIEEHASGGAATAQLQSALLLELLVPVIRRAQAERAAPRRAAPDNIHRLQGLLVEEARAEIERRLASREEVSVTDLARALQISPSHLSHTFREAAGRSVMAYVRAERMKHASERLRDSALSITDIARACGFESIHAFSRAFKRETGYAPRDYARSVRPEKENAKRKT
ncbi:MAG: helix-turn-helix transcriptional regulator [Planctomycetota bacterium]|nr:helix-turn-helix transcriptional regulator [Planctomycetota bacterium]